MGYAVYGHRAYNDRFAGYGVPALCDFPGCDEKIHRGVSFACGNDPDATCGKYFCGKHLQYEPSNLKIEDLEQWYKKADSEEETTWPRCPRCADEQWDTPEYPQKAELEEWIEFVLTDESWAEFLDTHPGIEEDWRRSDD